MAKIRFKPHQQESIIKRALSERKKIADLKKEHTFLISLRHLDQEQGYRPHEWDTQNILSFAIDILYGYSHKSLTEQTKTDKFTVYGDFPPKDKCDYTHPKQVPEDAQWARIHVSGEQCLIGHVVEQTFYLVFLDDHSFWKSKVETEN